MFEFCGPWIDELNGIVVTPFQAIFKLLLSLTLGSIVGLERKRKGQPAGIRTFALISIGATLAMIISIYVPQEYLGHVANGDPGRIAAQVLSGIGFLGAGAIIQMKGSVRGLTTAAGIWMIATIGLAVGVGMYFVACIATLLILFVLVQLEKIEHKVSLGSESRIIRIKLGTILEDVSSYRTLLKENHIHLSNVYVEYDYANNITFLNLVILAKEKTDYVSLLASLKTLNPTISISIANQLSV
ncbi:MAG: MgtC/SapB family protein [Muribaculaceae bacterium]|nr:MgtC/SapB family protein [Muribaculaceae bacterium]